MMEWGTWLAVLVLGPGSAALFIWFLFDLKRIFKDPGNDPGTESADEE